jgi:hypothetical protein
MNLCMDCRHIHDVGYALSSVYLCAHPKSRMAPEVSAVTGDKTSDYEPLAWVARKIGKCGDDGRLWEHKV